MDVQRLLFRFRKEGRARFLSHHDLMRLFERALRRAALPLRMSEGFHPHPRLSILSALPLGLEADDEALEVQLRPPLPAAEALARLRAQAPDGIELTAAAALPPRAPAWVASAAYEAELPPEMALAPEAVEQFLAREHLVVERATPKGTRSLDLRPAIEWMRLAGRRLAFQLRAGQGATPRPTEILAALLGRGPAADPAIRLRRTRLNLCIAPRANAAISQAPRQQEGTPNAT